jgi:hypothetical protein
LKYYFRALESFHDIREKLNLKFSMEIIIIAARSKWIVRNNKIFKNQRPTFQRWKAIYTEELRMVAHKMKKTCRKFQGVATITSLVFCFV